MNIELTWIHTSDVHGALLGYDWVNKASRGGGLPAVYAYVRVQRALHPDRLIVSDGGDMIQGDPAAYYANILCRNQPHVVSQMMNLVGYDVACIGNHDMDAGCAVCEEWMKHCNFPFVAANIRFQSSGDCYLSPYHIIERQGVRIAVVGLLTPVIPYWLPQRLWSGLYFEEMVLAARRTVKILRKSEHPHLIVGLFHSGWQGGLADAQVCEHAVRQVAQEVEGFDLICFGHDHHARIETLVNSSGKTVVCMAPYAQGASLCTATLRLTLRNNMVVDKQIQPRLVDLSAWSQQEDALRFEVHFSTFKAQLAAYIQEPIGWLARPLKARDAYFGPSAFIHLIHKVQLQATGADISLASPLDFDAEIPAGEVQRAHLFKLYKFENQLCTVGLYGHELRRVLEMVYDKWVVQMRQPDDSIMQMSPLLDGGRKMAFTNLAYNFDSASGIIYKVDVTKPCGEKVQIVSMSDGSAFDPDKMYRVTTNSYRALGGGAYFTQGAGLTQKELHGRLLFCSDHDLRHYLMQYIRTEGCVEVVSSDTWGFVPEVWTRAAIQRDRKLLFPDEI